TVFVIQGNGNVGIGITSPAQKLEVAGNIAVRNGTTSTQIELYETYTDGSNYERTQLKHTGGYFTINPQETGSGTQSGIDLSIGGASKLKIEPTGHVLIPDDVKLKLGTSGGDLQIYSDNSNTYIDSYNLSTMLFRQHFLDGHMSFQCDNGSGGVTEYFRCDGGVVYTIFSKEIRMLDGVQLQLGSDNDMQLQHNGANGYVQVATGDLVIKSTADDVKILSEDDILLRDIDDSTNFLHCINGGAVELFHNGTKKFETTSAGATVTGGITTTAASTIGGSLDIEGELNLTGNGNKNFDVYTLANSNTLTIRHHNPSGNLFETAAKFTANAGAELYYNHAKKFETTNGGVSITGALDAT
ncbi:MAG: hypothetical protein VX237_00030, partial [Chloroflexota bacterium]|nr:hypothetical protein [Chloroflexota bacterium]